MYLLGKVQLQVLDLPPGCQDQQGLAATESTPHRLTLHVADAGVLSFGVLRNHSHISGDS